MKLSWRTVFAFASGGQLACAAIWLVREEYIVFLIYILAAVGLFVASMKVDDCDCCARDESEE